MKTSALLLAAGSGAALAKPCVIDTIPEPAGRVHTTEPIIVAGHFDGQGYLYDRGEVVCQDQVETGEKDTIFILEDGASIENVIIGPNQAEGIHCRGTCTVDNVWWQDVCEDAISLTGDGVMTIRGGGAFHAEDKIVQVNGLGTVSISHFYAEDYGKIVRSCGNCIPNVGPREIILDNVVAVDGGVLCGINTNFGDTCTITNSCQSEGKTCDRFEGNDTGDEPIVIGSGPDDEFCFAEMREGC